MRIPLYLAVAQWALLLALGLLVVIAYRQLAQVLGQAGKPADLGPPPGSHPAVIAYQPLAASGPRVPALPAPRAAPVPDDDAGGLDQLDAMLRAAADQIRVFRPGGGQPALVAFVDPTCPSCEQLVASLSAAGDAGDLDGIRVLLLTSDPPGYLQISPAFQATALEVGRPVAREDLESYRPSATPLLVALDGAGAVSLAGVAARPSEVRAFIQSCRVTAPAPPALLPVSS